MPQRDSARGVFTNEAADGAGNSEEIVRYLNGASSENLSNLPKQISLDFDRLMEITCSFHSRLIISYFEILYILGYKE